MLVSAPVRDWAFLLTECCEPAWGAAAAGVAVTPALGGSQAAFFPLLMSSLRALERQPISCTAGGARETEAHGGKVVALCPVRCQGYFVSLGCP